MMMKRAALYALAVSLGASCYAQAEPTQVTANASQDAPAASDAPTSAPSEAPPAEAAPAVAPQAETTAASQQKGRIVFFRPGRLSGAVYTYHVVEVGDDGKPAKDAPHLGDLRNGGAFSYDAEPGIHSFNITGPMAINKAEDRLRMEVESDQTYYVEQTVRIGVVTGGFRLVPADEARFKAAKVKLAAEN